MIAPRVSNSQPPVSLPWQTHSAIDGDLTIANTRGQ